MVRFFGILSVLLVLLDGTSTSNAQTCNFATPSTICVWAPIATSITVGGPTTAWTQSENTTAATRLAAGASTGNVNICRSSSGANSQTCSAAQYSSVANWGESASTVNIGSTAVLVNIGGTVTTLNLGASATNVNMGNTAGTITIGSGAGTVNLATNALTAVNIATIAGNALITFGRGTAGANSQTMRIGGNSNSLELGSAANEVYLGVNAQSFVRIADATHAPVTLGSTAPTTSPSQRVDVGKRSSIVAIGDYATHVYMAYETATTISIGGNSVAPIEMGKTSITTPGPTQSRIKLKGLYHYYYSANCDNTRVSSTVFQCTMTDGVINGVGHPVQNNGPAPTSSPTVISGYNTAIASYCCPETGTYRIDFQTLSKAGAVGTQIRIKNELGHTLSMGYSKAELQMINIHALAYCVAGTGIFYAQISQGDIQRSNQEDNGFTRFTAYRVA